MKEVIFQNLKEINDPRWYNRLPWDTNDHKWGTDPEKNLWLNTTYNKRENDPGLWFLYGRIDILATLGYGNPNRVPALWLLNLHHVNDKPTMEIDIIEIFKKGRKDILAFSQWWHYNPHKGKSKKIRRQKVAHKARIKEFKYSLIWKKNYILWLMNDLPRFISFRNIPDEPLSIIVNDCDNVRELRIRSENFYRSHDRKPIT